MSVLSGGWWDMFTSAWNDVQAQVLPLPLAQILPTNDIKEGTSEGNDNKKATTIRSGHGGSFPVQIFQSGLLPWDH